MGKIKKILGGLIALIIIIGLPLVIFGSIYYLNEDFQLEANNVLRDAPGFIGDYFNKKPTKNEKETEKLKIAEYMLDIDKNRAVDKLEKIKVEDEQLYDDIVIYMMRDNPNRTNDILEIIRSHEIDDNLITSTINQIETEKNNELEQEANNLNKLSLPLAKEQMESTIDSSINGYLKLAQVLSNLENENIARLVDVLDDKDFINVLNNFSKDKRQKIRNIISEKRVRQNNLNNIIELYKSKSDKELATLLAPNSDYSMDDLSYIFTGLGPKLAGEVLAEIENEKFIVELTEKIKEKQILENGEDNLSNDITKSLKIFSQFDDNVNELTEMYKIMDPAKVASTLEEMMRTSLDTEIYTLSNGETIEITNEDIAIEVLNNFNQNKKSEVISNMTDAMASQVSKQLSVPRVY